MALISIPQGEHNCTICLGTACYVKNAAELLATLRQAYEIEPGQMTPDKQFCLNTARCLGSCGLAPVVLVDGNFVGRAQSESLLAQVQTVLASGRNVDNDESTEKATSIASERAL